MPTGWRRSSSRTSVQPLLRRFSRPFARFSNIPPCTGDRRHEERRKERKSDNNRNKHPQKFWRTLGRSRQHRNALDVSSYLRIKFPEEVNKSAMKTTCSVLNTRRMFPPRSAANMNPQLGPNISPTVGEGVKHRTGTAGLRWLRQQPDDRRRLSACQRPRRCNNSAAITSLPARLVRRKVSHFRSAGAPRSYGERWRREADAPLSVIRSEQRHRCVGRSSGGLHARY